MFDSRPYVQPNRKYRRAWDAIQRAARSAEAARLRQIQASRLARVIHGEPAPVTTSRRRDILTARLAACG